MTAPHAMRPLARLRRHAAWIIALLPCLLLRALLPPGVMLASNTGVGGVELCSAQRAPAQRSPAPHTGGAGAHGDSTCPCLLGAGAGPASVLPAAPPILVRIAWLDPVRAWTPPTAWRRMLPDARGPPAVDA